MSIVINPEDPVLTISPSEVSNAPKVKFWLPCTETGTISSLSEAVQGGTYTLSPTGTESNGAITIPNQIAPTYSLTQPTITGNFICLALINLDGLIANTGMGSNNQKIQFSTGGTTVYGNSGIDNFGAFTGETLQKGLITYDTAGNGILYQAALGSDLKAAGGTPDASQNTSVDPNDEGFNFSASLGTNNDVVMYGFAIIEVDSVTSNLIEWADWTLEQWGANNKVLPDIFREV